MGISTINKGLCRFSLVVQVGVFVTLCAVLSIFLMLSLYTWPSSADDLCLAVYFEEHGVLGGLYGKYMLWSGGYTSIFLMGAVPQLGDYYAFYKILPLTIILLTVWASTAFFRDVLGTTKFSFWSCVLGVSFTMLFISSMPLVVSGFYWFASAAKYQGGNILLICLLVVFMRLAGIAGQPSSFRATDYLIAGVCIALGVGFSETQMMMFYAVVTLMCFWRVSAEHNSRRSRFIWIGLFILLNCCVAIYIFAPGNSIRSEAEGSVQLTSTSVSHAIHASLIVGLQGMKKYLSLPQLGWFSLLLAIVVLSMRSGKLSADSEPARVPGAYVALGLLFCLIFPIIFQIPSFLFLSLPPPLRTENAILFSFLLSWCVTLVLFLRWLLDRWPTLAERLTNANESNTTIRSVLCSVFLIGFCSSVITSSNIQVAYGDLTEIAPAYSEFMSDRFQELQKIKGTGKTIAISQYKNPPTTIHSLDIVSKTDGLDFTKCFAEYFGVDLKVFDEFGVIGAYNSGLLNAGDVH